MTCFVRRVVIERCCVRRLRGVVPALHILLHALLLPDRYECSTTECPFGEQADRVRLALRVRGAIAIRGLAVWQPLIERIAGGGERALEQGAHLRTTMRLVSVSRTCVPRTCSSAYCATVRPV